MRAVLDTAQKMKFLITDFLSKCDQIRMVTFTEEIRNGKLHFLCSERFSSSFPVFVKLKVTINETESIIDHASVIRLPDCSK